MKLWHLLHAALVHERRVRVLSRWIASYLPDSVAGNIYYEPGDAGFEKEIKERLNRWWPDRKRGKK